MLLFPEQAHSTDLDSQKIHTGLKLCSWRYLKVKVKGEGPYT